MQSHPLVLAEACEELGVTLQSPLRTRFDLALTLLTMLAGTLLCAVGAAGFFSIAVGGGLMWVLLAALPAAALSVVYGVLTVRYARRAAAISRLLGGGEADACAAQRAMLDTEQQAWDLRRQAGFLVPLVWLVCGLLYLGLAGGMSLGAIGVVAAPAAVVAVLFGAYGWFVRLPILRTQMAALTQLEDQLRLPAPG